MYLVVYYLPAASCLVISNGFLCADVSLRNSLLSGPALGMFEVFGRTGPQNLGEAQIWTPQKLTCHFERL